MSYREAIADGIPHSKGLRGGFTEYYPPCFYCGKPAHTWSYRPGIKYTCIDCKKGTRTGKYANPVDRADDF